MSNTAEYTCISDEDMPKAYKGVLEGNETDIYYYIGGLVERNRDDEAITLAKELVEKGHLCAASAIASHMYQVVTSPAVGGKHPDSDKYIEWMKIAVQDDGLVGADASFDLGIFYYENEQYNEAFPLLKKAATYGFAEAAVMVGDCYHLGHGVAIDYLEAARWFMKVVEYEDDGLRYLNGSDWPVDKESGWVDKELLSEFMQHLNDAEIAELLTITKTIN